MRPELIQILSAGFAGIGFAMIFQIRPKYLPVAFWGAALSWMLYLLSNKFWDSRVISMMIAAFGVTVHSEIAARVVKMPVSVIYTPSIIPLIPGSHLYYSLRGFVTNSHMDFLEEGAILLEETLGIVLGSMLVLTIVSAMTKRKRSG